MTDQGLSIFDEEPGEDATAAADEDATQVMPAVPAEKPSSPSRRSSAPSRRRSCRRRSRRLPDRPRPPQPAAAAPQRPSPGPDRPRRPAGFPVVAAAATTRTPSTRGCAS